MLFISILLYIVGIIVALVVQGVIASAFADQAVEKGYNHSTYFWLCFLLGVIGYCLVAALPDKHLHAKIDRLLAEQKAAHPEITANPVPSVPQSTTAVATDDGGWICGNCNTRNSNNYGQCKKCGRFRG